MGKFSKVLVSIGSFLRGPLVRDSKFIPFWFVIFLVVGIVPLRSQDSDEKIGFRKLDNGLAVVLIHQPEAQSITAICGLKAGTVDDPPGFGGTAHLIEHLMKRAMFDALPTKALAGELSEEYAKGGAMDPQKINDLEKKLSALEEQLEGLELIAASTFDFVYYRGTFSSNQLELFCRMGSELLKENHLEGVMRERETLLAERKREWDGKFGEQIQALTFRSRPYGRPIGGNPDEILAITPAVASEFKKKHYIPNNCVLVFVGDINQKLLFSCIEKYFGEVPRGGVPQQARIFGHSISHKQRLVLEVETKPGIQMNFVKPAFPHKDDLVSRVLGIILTKGAKSRLTLDLIKTRHLADEVAAGWAPGERYENAFWLYMIPNARHSLEEIETALLGHLEKLKTDPVREDELQDAKDAIVNDLDIHTQTDLQAAMTAMRYQLIHGDFKLGLKTRELCDGVSPDDIREFARKYFTPENRTTIVSRKKGVLKPESLM